MSIVINDMKLAAEKLVELTYLAGEAETGFEKAAVYAAVTTLVAQFEQTEEALSSYLSENLERVRWHVCAAVGYDVDNGHDSTTHVSWARGAAGAVKGLVSDLKG